MVRGGVSMHPELAEHWRLRTLIAVCDVEQNASAGASGGVPTTGRGSLWSAVRRLWVGMVEQAVPRPGTACAQRVSQASVGGVVDAPPEMAVA